MSDVFVITIGPGDSQIEIFRASLYVVITARERTARICSGMESRDEFTNLIGYTKVAHKDISSR
jgi:hypothetical protein